MKLAARARRVVHRAARAIAGPAPRRSYYEGARPSPHHRRHPWAETPDGATRGAIEPLRAEVRYLEQNYDLVSGALDVLVNNTVGRGLRPRPIARSVSGELHDDFNRACARLFSDWTRAPEVTGELDYWEAQRLLARTLYRDGEAFSQRIAGFVKSLDHLTEVPYSLELLEPDLLPVSFHDPKRRITSSIEKNDWGRPRRFWCYRSYPGEAFGGAGRRILAEPDKGIPAEFVTHLKMASRIRQTRGVPVLASCLDRIDSIKDGEESELVAMRVAAAMTGYIKKGAPEDFDETVDDDKTPRELRFDPGAMYELEPGEDVGTIQSNRPNNQLIAFLEDQHRRVAAGAKVSYSSLSKNYNGTFSAQRQELVEQHVTYAVLSDYFVRQQVEPDYRGVIRTAIAAGILVVPPDVDPRTVLDVEVPKPAMPWIDPKKEAEGWEVLVDMGVESRAHVMATRGREPEAVFAEMEHEAKHHPRPAPAARAQSRPDDDGGDGRGEDEDDEGQAGRA